MIKALRRLLLFWKRAEEDKAPLPAERHAKQASLETARTSTKFALEGAPPRRAARMPRPAPLINLGVDFGTSSTKVFWRDVLSDRYEVLSFAGGTAGYARYCLPSTLAIAKGRFVFGHEAEKSDSGVVFRSLKVCLACRMGAVECRGCPNLAGEVEGPGQFFLSDDSGTRMPIDAEELCSLLLAGVIGSVKVRLLRDLPDHGRATVTVNMSAPLDQLEHSKLKAAFERVLHAGTSLADNLVGELPFRDAHRLYVAFRSAGESVPPEGERRWAIVPEAIAAVHAYCESPAADDGLYALIDVGAGTTNVSFFRFTRHLEKPVAFYASHTAVVGADDVDRALALALVAKYCGMGGVRDLLHEVRIAKQHLDDGSLRLSSGRSLSKGEVGVAVNPVIERIWGVYSKAFGLAYGREALVSRWSQLNVVLVGGGTLIPAVRARLLRAPRDFGMKINESEMRLPQTGVPRGSERPKADGTSVLLTVGFGLSFARAQIPDYWRTEEVEPIGPSPARMPEPEDWR